MADDDGWLQVASTMDGSIRENSRSVVSARNSRLGFLDLADLSALVVPAMRTDLMRRLRFVTLRTCPDSDRLQRVVRATLRRARLGMPAFRIGHLNSPSVGSAAP